MIGLASAKCDVSGIRSNF